MHPSFIAPKNTAWVFILLLAGLILLLRLPSLDEPLDNDSGANAFLARQILRGETLYDTFHPGHHLPGIYYTFELAFKLFGDHPNAPKLLLLPWALVCIWLLYFLGCTYFGEQIGRLAAFFFVLVSSQRCFAGMTVEMEHFANLPLIAGFSLLIILLRQRAPAWKFCFVGLLSAICILYKVIFVAPLFVAGLSISLMAWITRQETGAWKTMFARLTWLAAGLMIPLAMIAGYFASMGLWDRFMLIFQFGFHYFSDRVLMIAPHLPPPFGFPFYWIGMNNIALLIFGLMGMVRLLRRSLPVRGVDQLTDLVVVLWLVSTFAMVGLRGGGFAYYVLPAIPPLALIASMEISMAYQQWKAVGPLKQANLGRSTCIAFVFCFFLISNVSFYRDHALYKLNRISDKDFLQNMGEGFSVLQISDYVKTHTKSDDLIYLWGNRVETYYYADRLPPVDILWPTYIEATGSHNRIFDPRTKYIVVDKPGQMDYPQWLVDGLVADYELETVIDERKIYRRVR